MKKIFKAAALCCAVSLSACSSKKNNTVTAPDGTLDKCTLRFSWWGGDDRHKATLDAIGLWNKKHPDISITPEYGGWDGWTEKVSAQIKSGTEPDIMQINYDWLISMSEGGSRFYDLDSLDTFLDTSGYDDEILSFGRVNGRLSALTVSVSGRSLFYNSDVFGSLGAKYPKTWTELTALGKSFGIILAFHIFLHLKSGYRIIQL